MIQIALKTDLKKPITNQKNVSPAQTIARN